MPIPNYALPFGLRQVKLTPINPTTGALVSASSVLLPASRTFSFTETEEFEDLDGDDRRIASHGAGPVVEWELEGGGISLAVWKVLAGGTVTDTGVSPAAIRKYTKLVTDARPYFQVEGVAISDNGGDFHGVVYKCKADGDLEAEMSNGSFLLTAASGHGLGDDTTGKLYDWVHNETAAAPMTSGT